MASHRLLKKASGGEPSPTPESRSDMTSSTSMGLGEASPGIWGESHEYSPRAPGQPQATPQTGGRGSCVRAAGAPRGEEPSSQLLSAGRCPAPRIVPCPSTCSALEPAALSRQEESLQFR